MKVIVASKNQSKLKEIQGILKNLNLEIISMNQAGICIDVEEYGKTFRENALIKASYIHKITGSVVIADDSGLEIDYLDGAPGVFSSRFAGVGSSDEEKNSIILEKLKDVPIEKRTARFVCVIAVVVTDKQYFTSEGVLEGRIALQPDGKNGFGYDPIFFVPEYNMTIGVMPPDMKNSISHRGKALTEMARKLEQLAIY